MNTKLLNNVTKEYVKVEHPNFSVGDIIEVHNILREESKERIQVFKGIVISIKGSGVSKTFTVRKISYGIGVEKKFPLYSPSVKKIKIIKRAKGVRKSKLYYLRERVGKAALRAGMQVPAVGENLETKFDESQKEKIKESEEEESSKADDEVADVKAKDESSPKAKETAAEKSKE